MSCQSDSEDDDLFVMLDGDGRVFGCGEGINHNQNKQQRNLYVNALFFLFHLNCFPVLPSSDLSYRPATPPLRCLLSRHHRNAGLSYEFGAWRGLPPLLDPRAVEDMVGDCALVDSALTKGAATFWLGAGDEPRTALEDLARCIFRLHTAQCDADDFDEVGRRCKLDPSLKATGF